jgi:hypothetical protein
MTPTIGWGTLYLNDNEGPNIQCRIATVGDVTNVKPFGGQNEAHAETELFASTECKSEGGACTAPGEVRLTPQNIEPHAPLGTRPVWSWEFVEEKNVGLEEEFRGYDQSEGANRIRIELARECWSPVSGKESLVFFTGPNKAGRHGSLTPAWLNGTTPTKPSEISFGSSEGRLVTEQLDEGTPGGKLKVVGFKDNAATPFISLGGINAP